jgi:hypothetical protein
MFPLKTILLSVLTVLVLLLTVGCQSPETAAYSLFQKGAYEEVIKKFPDTQYARRARAAIAEALFTKGDYEQVINNYSDTPAAYKSKTSLATKLFDQGKYQEIINKFPTFPIAMEARNKLADSLFVAGRSDLVLSLYPNSPRAAEIQNQAAQELLDQAKKLRGKARQEKLLEVQTKYKATPAGTEAGQLIEAAKPGAKKK